MKTKILDLYRKLRKAWEGVNDPKGLLNQKEKWMEVSFMILGTILVIIWLLTKSTETITHLILVLITVVILKSLVVVICEVVKGEKKVIINSLKELKIWFASTMPLSYLNRLTVFGSLAVGDSVVGTEMLSIIKDNIETIFPMYIGVLVFILVSYGNYNEEKGDENINLFYLILGITILTTVHVLICSINIIGMECIYNVMLGTKAVVTISPNELKMVIIPGYYLVFVGLEDKDYTWWNMLLSIVGGALLSVSYCIIWMVLINI